MKIIENFLFDKKIKLLLSILQGESYKEYQHENSKEASHNPPIKIVKLNDELKQKLLFKAIFDKKDFNNITHLIIPDLSWTSLMKVTQNIQELLLDDLTLSKNFAIISQKNTKNLKTTKQSKGLTNAK